MKLLSNLLEANQALLVQSAFVRDRESVDKYNYICKIVERLICKSKTNGYQVNFTSGMFIVLKEVATGYYIHEEIIPLSILSS